eukprot:GEZU01036146.1.p1 GENE.GEZU01036146.1~~GEZU01036146.1.p1  ORF type:complete len:199 (+),score=21.99 GEZU01036146.1:119-715(+)
MSASTSTSSTTLSSSTESSKANPNPMNNTTNPMETLNGISRNIDDIWHALMDLNRYVVEQQQRGEEDSTSHDSTSMASAPSISTGTLRLKGESVAPFFERILGFLRQCNDTLYMNPLFRSRISPSTSSSTSSSTMATADSFELRQLAKYIESWKQNPKEIIYSPSYLMAGNLVVGIIKDITRCVALLRREIHDQRFQP